MEKEPVIQFRDFTFKYTAQAEPTLYDINLTINRGEKILICGPSGCGKSTLVHTLNGLIPASYNGEAKGELILGGKSFREHDIFSLSKFMGTVLQDSDGQFIGLTVGEDIAFALENDCKGLSEMRQRVSDVADRVGVRDFLGHAPHEISGGQKQRVALAGVMVDDVQVLLFDEPLANLDPETGKTTIELIDEIHKNTGSTIIIVEHRLEDVLYRDVDRVVLIKEGRIAFDGSPSELLCSDLLVENGIREPLYISALKYSKVELKPEMCVQRIDTLKLSDDDVQKVRAWFDASRKSPDEEKRDVLLSARNIVFSYQNGKKALDDVSLDVYQGEMLAIVGRNGAGKSTFAKNVCGFEKPQKGSFILQGSDIRDLSIKEKADHIGYVMQNPNQMISKSFISDEVGLGLVLRGKSEADVKQAVNDTLRICGLYPFRSWPVSALSYGQKKRVTIASILAMKPQIIILDEPTAGQDFRHYTEIMEFLRTLNESGITIIMITHDMHLMLEYCSRAVVFSGGKVVMDDRCEKVLTCDDVIAKASLKKTSLSDLAHMCGIDDATAFIRTFIDFDREVRR